MLRCVLLKCVCVYVWVWVCESCTQAYLHKFAYIPYCKRFLHEYSHTFHPPVCPQDYNANFNWRVACAQRFQPAEHDMRDPREHLQLNRSIALPYATANRGLAKFHIASAMFLFGFTRVGCVGVCLIVYIWLKCDRNFDLLVHGNMCGDAV